MSESLSQRPRVNPLKTAVIFDMDGTLTHDQFDFDAIRREIGLPDGPARRPILESLEQMTDAQRARAEAILHRHETHNARTSELQPGAREIVDGLRRRGYKVALMTRNSRDSARTFLDRHALAFDHVRTREDGLIKPDPTPVREVCTALDRSPKDAWVVGDYHFDILCGRGAGATTVLLWAGDRAVPPVPRPDWACEADHVISRLVDLLTCMGLDSGDSCQTPRRKKKGPAPRSKRRPL